jgi:Holliday junction resolvase RusA-like endonuclease
MKQEIAFSVRGVPPAPKGSFVCIRGHPVPSFRKGLDAWVRAVREAAIRTATSRRGLKIFAVAEVELTFYVSSPRSRPDIDKLIRSTLDALTGITWLDDSIVVSVAAKKVRAASAQERGADIYVFGEA